MSNPKIDPRVAIGHVHLKVADLARALDFYCGVLGFAGNQRLAMFTRPLDLPALLGELSSAPADDVRDSIPMIVMGRDCLAPHW